MARNLSLAKLMRTFFDLGRPVDGNFERGLASRGTAT